MSLHNFYEIFQGFWAAPCSTIQIWGCSQLVLELWRFYLVTMFPPNFQQPLAAELYVGF